MWPGRLIQLSSLGPEGPFFSITLAFHTHNVGWSKFCWHMLMLHSLKPPFCCYYHSEDLELNCMVGCNYELCKPQQTFCIGSLPVC